MKKYFRLTSIIVMIALLCTFAFYGCGDKDRFVEEDITYYIDTFNINTMIQLDIMSLNGIDRTNSYIILRKDGTCTIRITPNKSLILLGNNVLSGLDSSKLDVESFVATYLASFFPGFTVDDVQGSFELIKRNVGMEIIGIDYNDPEIIALCNALKEGVLPDDLTIPSNLAIEINSEYYIETVHSEYTGDYKGVFIGKHYDKEVADEPYMIMTMYNNAEGKACVKTTFEILSCNINGTAA